MHMYIQVRDRNANNLLKSNRITSNMALSSIQKQVILLIIVLILSHYSRVQRRQLRPKEVRYKQFEYQLTSYSDGTIRSMTRFAPYFPIGKYQY